jgi:serine/threonine protein phosphatase PrpC
MVQPKVNQLSVMGAKHKTNDDYAIVNQEQGIYVLCDGVSEGGNGRFASEFISKQVQERLTEANHFIKKNGANLLGPKRLQKMQELLLSAYSEAQSALLKLGATNENYKNAHTTCITLWVDGRFAILAHIGDSRAYLYRAGKVYQLTKDHNGYDELVKMGMTPEDAAKNPLAKSLAKAFGARFTQPDLLKIEFQPNDILIFCTDGVYTVLQNQGFPELVQAMIQGKDYQSAIEQCARLSGDDSTLVQVQFPKEMHQEAGIQASDRIKLIQATPLSKYFDYIQKSHVAAVCEIETFKAGSMIFQEGNEGECMYVVASGMLEVTLKGQNLTFKGPGEFIGEVALLQRGKRTASVIAKEDSTLLSLQRADLDEVFKKDPSLERHFYRAMLEMVMERMVEQGREIAQLRRN